MKILVANLGSTSFKYRLFDMKGEVLLARGGVERIGSPESRCFVEAGDANEEMTREVPDHAAAVRMCLEQLSDPRLGCLSSPAELSAIGFKAVHAKDITGVRRVDDRVLAGMDAYADVTPAHNPPYVKAMRLLATELPEIPLVAAFETDFHETIDPASRTYAIPHEWTELYGIRKWGFHGASHRYIAVRTKELFDKQDLKVISCHLGGSSSLCAIRDGKSVATTMGMSPQTGLPQNNRTGDFDCFALPALMRATGKTLEQLLDDLATNSGLLGMSGVSNDLRDIETQKDTNPRAKLALDVYIRSIRHYLGAYMMLLGGVDAIVFTGGIGENSVAIREEVCADLDWFGVGLDLTKNREAQGEIRLDREGSRSMIWIVPTNEEIIVARQTMTLLQAAH